MPWLLLLVALGALIVAFNTTSLLLMGICLVAALALAIVAVMQLLSERLDNATRNEAQMLDPEEMRRLHEAAEARRLAAGAGAAPPASGPRT